jgi:hypothetical protein
MSQHDDRFVAHHEDVSENLPPPAGQHVPDETVEQPAARPARTSWRQRTWSLPVVVAVALVAVLLGGLGGAALASVGGHQDGRRGPGSGGFRHGPGGFGPGQQPGQQFGQQFGQRQRQGQQPGGNSGQTRPFGNGASPSPAPASPSPTS